MIETIYANGCSFTAGSELEHELDVPADPVQIAEIRRERSWPQLLGDALGSAYVVNEARGGGSNARAVRMTYQFVDAYLGKGHDPSRLLVVLGVTDLVRSEFRSPDGTWELLKPNLADRSNKKRFVRTCNHFYYRHFSDISQATQFHAHQFLGLHTFLNEQGVRHHFHEAMANNALLLSRSSEAISVLRFVDVRAWRGLSQDGGKVAFDASNSFESWAVQAGVQLGPGGHPLARGHRLWAELLLNDIHSLA